MEREKRGLENIGIPPIIVMPKSHISQTSLSSKERVLINVSFGLGKHIIVDITNEVDKTLNNKPWKILRETEDFGDSVGSLTFTKHVSIHTDVSDDGELIIEMDAVCVKFNVDDSELTMDVTEAVRSIFKSEVLSFIRQHNPRYFMLGPIGKKMAVDLFKGGNTCQVL